MSTLLFPKVSPLLVANGYRPVPITPGTKAPTKLPRWQKYDYTPADDARFVDCGTGILTGDVLGVDIDVPDVDLVKDLLGWLLRRYDVAPVRYGNKPKTLALYRAALPGQRKAQTTVYKRGALKGKVEVLARGQQFVAYAIHPTTKRPYEWRGGDPLTVPANKLPVLTGEQVSEIIEHGAALLALWGEGTAPAQPDLSLGGAFTARGPGFDGAMVDNDALKTQIPPVTVADLTRALADYAEFDVGDYDSWREVGAVIHHETGGSEAGLELFIRYSRTLTGFYDGPEAGEKGCRTRWRSFGRSGARPVTFGTLVHGLATLRRSGTAKKLEARKPLAPNYR
jgi:hypothetical protein